MANKSLFYRLTRNLHLYFGLFISPFLLVFAVSVFFLVHAWLPGGGRQKPTRTRQHVSLQTPAEIKGLDLAMQVRRQLGLDGEIEYIVHEPQENRLHFPIVRPGWRATVDMNLRTGIAEIVQQETGPWDAMVYLHKSPGPHNVAIRGNWIYTKIWTLLTDATVYLSLLVSVTGVYLWTLLKAERKVGLGFLGAGVLSFILALVSLIY